MALASPTGPWTIDMEELVIRYVKEGFLAALIVYLLYRERLDRKEMLDTYQKLKEAIDSLTSELRRKQ